MLILHVCCGGWPGPLFFFHGFHVSHVSPKVPESVYPKNKKCVSRDVCATHYLHLREGVADRPHRGRLKGPPVPKLTLIKPGVAFKL